MAFLVSAWHMTATIHMNADLCDLNLATGNAAQTAALD